MNSKKIRVVFLIIMCLAVNFMMGCENYTSSVKEETGGTQPKYPEKPKVKELADASVINDPDKWGNLYSHDPSILKGDDGYYYIYSTDVGNAGGVGIQIKRSKDLISWKFIGHALTEIPKEAVDWASPSNLWAPDIIKVGNEYRLYYAASTFGSQKSAIMLAVSSKPEGPFKDKGIVLKTDAGDPVNAIDPNIVVDHSTGDMYMCYGSFWGGINILKMDRTSGFTAEKGFGKNIACRTSSVDGAVEGPYIKYNAATGYYYLFVSYGSLSSNYNVRVGRSKSVTGPYKDYNGNEMTDTLSDPDSVGLKITSGYKFGNGNGWMALGHNSVLEDGNHWYIVCHARPTGDVASPYLQVRTIVWSKDGWPMVNPEMYAGEKEQKIDPKRIAGTYDRVKFKNSTSKLSTESTKMYFKGDNTCMIDNEKGRWKLLGQDDLKVIVGDSKETYKVLCSWDWENSKPTITLTGMNNKGICIWAKKQ